MKNKNVPFRLQEDIHAKFKGYCGIQKITMQAFLEDIVKVVIEKNATPAKVIEAIRKID